MTMLHRTCTVAGVAAALGACNLLTPRVSDEPIDAPAAEDASPTPDGVLLPAGAQVPSIGDDAELASQIRIFDGLNDAALAAAGGVVTRSTGKAGATVRFWSFGAVPLVDGFVPSSALYVLCDDDGTGVLTPRTDHPWLIDGIPGDPRYSPIRRVINVPVTARYRGERVTSVAALAEALDRGLVREPVPAGTWRNMPVVPTGVRLEVGGAAVTVPATEVFGRGYRVELFALGGARGVQPLRNNTPPLAQESRLLSGVASGAPPALPTTLDPQPVFQLGIPSAPPTTTFNYTPIVSELDVRLADAIDPTAIAGDAQLFRRAANGSISGYLTDNVASFVATTTVSNKQLQFEDGEP